VLTTSAIWICYDMPGGRHFTKTIYNSAGITGAEMAQFYNSPR